MSDLITDQLSIFDYLNEEGPQQVEYKLDYKQLIIEDILKGTGFQGGKQRVYEVYTDNTYNNVDDRISFLKKEYGIGGYSFRPNKPFQVCGRDVSGNNYLLFYSDGNLNKVAMPVSWKTIDSTLKELIKQGKYIDAMQKQG